jgi:hypothetical protein
MFRRKELPDGLVPAYEAFLLVLDEIEPAKAGLTDVVPGSRLPGRPLHAALDEFVARLARAADLMPGWRRPELESVWSACSDGVSAARREAAALIADASEPSGFTAILSIVERLLDPLEAFAAAEARFEELRRRRVRTGKGIGET